MKYHLRKPVLVEAQQWKGRESRELFWAHRVTPYPVVQPKPVPDQCPICKKPWVDHADFEFWSSYGRVRITLHPGDWVLKEPLDNMMSRMSNEDFVTQYQEADNETLPT